MAKLYLAVVIVLGLSSWVFAADNLHLNPKLDYTTDSQDGPLITGDHMQDGAVKGKPNYVIIYAEGCFNSKRQARRTVSLWEKYRERVQFVVVDLDQQRSPAQRELVERYYRGYIPQVVVLNASGKPLYNSSGEVEESTISSWLDKALSRASE